jgi:hypothetical protein
VLLDLSTTAQINDSMKLGRSVLGEIGGINRLHKGSVEQAGFAVLKAPDIPSILIETAFISNPEEEAKLLDEATRTSWPMPSSPASAATSQRIHRWQRTGLPEERDMAVAT